MNTLVAWLWQGVAVTLVASLAVRLIPGAAAAKRHAIWWLALAAVIVVPWLSAFWPDTSAAASDVPAAVAAADPALVLPPPPDWLQTGVAAVWCAVFLFSALRLVINLRALRRLDADAVALDPAREARFHVWRAARASSRAADLRLSHRILGACALGFWRPRILVSSDLAATMDDEALEALVLHEYAHLQRYDDWTRLGQQMTLAVVGLHPAVRWISRRIDLEREVACDQRVVARMKTPLAYARSLATAAERVALGRGLMPVAAPGASTSGSMLEARVRRLLETKATWHWWPRAASVAAVFSVMVSTVVAGRVPPLVAFSSFEAQLASLASTPFSAALAAWPGRAPGLRSWEEPQAQDAPLGQTRAASDQIPQRADLVVAEERDRLPNADVVAGSVDPASPQEATGLATVALSARSLSDAQSWSPAPDREDSLARPFVTVGTGAAAAGAATGEAVARTGQSVGRFFRNGSVAIARLF